MNSYEISENQTYTEQKRKIQGVVTTSLVSAKFLI